MLKPVGNKSSALFLAGILCMAAMTGYGGASLAIQFLMKADSGTIPVSAVFEAAKTVNNGAVSNAGAVLSDSGDEAPSLTIPQIAAFAADSVVEITTETVSSGNRIRQYVTEGAGSGVVISSDGHIVTNNHVVAEARKITVRLISGESYEAALVGRDVQTDLAVLKIDAVGLHAAVFGNSDALAVGELAVAIGNPLGQLGGTVTEGIISALNRTIVMESEEMTLLQTTAAINPGNSGGALFNGQARLIGIVNAKSSGSDIEGLGFAIPVNTVKSVVEQIMSYGYVPGRIDLGVTFLEIPDEMTAMQYRVRETGVYVSSVSGSATLQVGDRIVSVDGTAISSASEIQNTLKSFKVGDSVKLLVDRSSQLVEVNVTLNEAKY
jgi:serine protease Do